MAKKPWEEGPDTPSAHSGVKPWEEGPESANALAPTAHSAPTHQPTLMESIKAGMQPGAHPYWDKLTAYNEPDFSHPVHAAGTMFSNLGGRFIKGVGDMLLPGGGVEGAAKLLRHPIDSAQSFREQLKVPGTEDTPDPRAILRVGTDTAAQAAALGPVAEAVPGALKSTGKVLRGAGRWAGEATLGTDAVDRANSQPGAGISRNRVVAASRPGMLKKVMGKVGPLKAQEADVLANSPSAQNATPINAREIIQRPFNDTIARTTNYQTGAGDPAQLKAHWKADQALNYQQDPTSPDGFARDPVSGQPIPKAIDSLNPLQTSNFKSNMYRMANYDTPDNTLANQDIKLGARGLRDAIIRAVPESEPATNQLENTESAGDVLQRQRGLSLQGNTPFSQAKLLDMVRVPVGSTLASGLDLAGAGLEHVGEALSPTVQGGGPTRSSSQPPPRPQGNAPTLAGQLAAPQAPLPQGQPQLASGHVVTPPPAPIAGGLPGNVQGPLTRVVTRTPNNTQFGPKVEAPAFSKPVGYGDSEIMSPAADRRNAEGNANPLADRIKGRRKGDTLVDRLMENIGGPQ